MITEIAGVHSWFNDPEGGRSLTKFDGMVNDDALTYGSGWAHATGRSDIGDYHSDVTYTTTPGATAEYTFYGKGFQLLSELNNDQGSLDVYIDGTLAGTANEHNNGPRLAQQTVFQRSGLSLGTHTIKLVNKTTSVGMVDALRIDAGVDPALLGRSYGVAVAGLHQPDGRVDSQHGQVLAGNLGATVNAGATATLVEGFTDYPEDIPLFRVAEGSYQLRAYDYPSQRLNILRRYSHNPFPNPLRVEAETADSYSDTTPGNRWNLYRDGAVDVERAGDTGGGWDVGDINDNEWLQWQEVPLQATVNLTARVASPNNGGQLRFVIDGVAGPTAPFPTRAAGRRTKPSTPERSPSTQGPITRSRCSSQSASSASTTGRGPRTPRPIGRRAGPRRCPRSTTRPAPAISRWTAMPVPAGRAGTRIHSGSRLTSARRTASAGSG